MTKKLTRRDFLKGTGKVTAALAAIWAVGAGVSASPIEETPETDVIEEDEDIWNETCHPYFVEYRGHMPIQIRFDDDGELVSYDGGKTWERR